MKILGISTSARPESTSNCYRLTERVLKATGLKYELISLRGKHINGCTGCLGCVKDNVCVVKDDMLQMRDKLVAADAFVIAAPNYYNNINGLGQCMLERWFQFRHRGCDAMWGKLAVAIGVGASNGDEVVEQIGTFMEYNFIETVANISAQGTASCFSCGYGETCPAGAPVMMMGEGVRITDDMIPDVDKQPDVLRAADNAGRLLAERLRSHDKIAVAKIIQEAVRKRFREG